MEVPLALFYGEKDPIMPPGQVSEQRLFLFGMIMI
jgi:hypothetical protein